MEEISIRKYTEFKITINKDFNIVFKDNSNEDSYSFPIAIDDSVISNVPKNENIIIDFLNHKKEILEGEDVYRFFYTTNIDMSSFVWLFIEEAEINIFFMKYFCFMFDITPSKKHIVDLRIN